MSSTNDTREFVSLGMFIIDEFTFVDEKGEPTEQSLPPQVCVLAIVSAECAILNLLATVRLEVEVPTPPSAHAYGAVLRFGHVHIGDGSDSRYSPRLPPSKLGVIIDRGNDFPSHIQAVLDAYGSDMWLFRDNPDRGTARARNSYQGESRGYV